jgi:hypothetical protein
MQVAEQFTTGPVRLDGMLIGWTMGGISPNFQLAKRLTAHLPKRQAVLDARHESGLEEPLMRG